MYRELCRSFYAKEVVPHHAKWEEQGEVMLIIYTLLFLLLLLLLLYDT